MEPLNVSYKDFHETYLSHLTGTTLLDVPIFLTVVLLVGFHVLCLKIAFYYSKPSTCFIVETLTFALPLVCLVNCFNEFTLPCFFLGLSSAGIWILHEMVLRDSKIPTCIAATAKISVKRRPFVTNFKSVISFLTVVCILAVDFTVFPQKYAKTETYGYSLMDTGVAFYVVANGLTVPVKTDCAGWLKKSLLNNAPIMILGVVRYLSVEKINYQKHVSEYGVHWNFFFTLAFVKLFGALLMNKIPKSLTMTSVSIIVAHQAALSSGLENWVLSDAPRSSLLSANREGVVSLPGYLGLYLAAVCLGEWLLYNKRPLNVQQELDKGLKCFAVAVALFISTFILAEYLPPSRRLANLTFIVWMSAICLQVLAYSIAIESFFVIVSIRRNSDIYRDKTAYLLEAISANNLLFFLLGNLLTGAVNISMQTLFVPPLTGMMIIFSYVAVLCGIICTIHAMKWRLKCW